MLMREFDSREYKNLIGQEDSSSIYPFPLYRRSGGKLSCALIFFLMLIDFGFCLLANSFIECYQGLFVVENIDVVYLKQSVVLTLTHHRVE